MKTFARVATLGLLCIAASAVNACSSDDDDKAAGPSSVADAFPTNKQSGTYITEAEACERIVAAYDKVLKREGCTYTGAALQCPTYLRNGAPTNKCADFDKGVLDYCVDTYIPALTCAKLPTNPCILTVRPNPTAAAAGTCDAAGGAGGAAGAGAGGAAGAEAGGSAGASAGGSAGASAGGSAGAAAGGSAGAAAGGSAGATAGGSAGAAAGGSAGAAAGGSAGAAAGGSAGASAGGSDAGGAAGASAGAGGSDAAGAGGAAAGSAGAGS